MKHLPSDIKLTCCCCGREIIVLKASGIMQARYRAHKEGWASTSMDSPSAKDACPECVKKHKEYEKGRPFKRSTWAQLANAIGNHRANP